MAKSLSRRQERILEFIQQFCRKYHFPPTIREIQEECEITSTSVVDYNLRGLEEMGYLRRNKKISRGIELLVPALDLAEMEPVSMARRNVASVPVSGYIAAGEPIQVPEDPIGGEFAERVELSLSLLRGKTDDLFALRVKGTSMIDALINDGDLVVLRAAEECINGEIVAVWLKDEGETTLKRFYREGEERIRLQPENPTMAPIYCHPSNVEIKGKLVGVLRTLN